MRPIQSPLSKQRGVALFAALIALVILLIATLALVQSTDTAQMISGNLAVRRDLTHESEIAIAVALANFNTGSLTTEASRYQAVGSANYSPIVLASNVQGIPTSLISAAASGDTSAFSTNNTTYAFVIDRMCPQAGAPTPNCIFDVANDRGGDIKNNPTSLTQLQSRHGNVIYRVSVRMTDPRGTQTYAQTTFSSFGS